MCCSATLWSLGVSHTDSASPGHVPWPASSFAAGPGHAPAPQAVPACCRKPRLGGRHSCCVLPEQLEAGTDSRYGGRCAHRARVRCSLTFVFVIAAELTKHHCTEKAETYKWFPANGIRAYKQCYFLHLPSENMKLFPGNITLPGRGVSNTYKTSVNQNGVAQYSCVGYLWGAPQEGGIAQL